MADRKISLAGSSMPTLFPGKRIDCLLCEGLRWYRPDSLSDLRPCHFCLEAGRPMLPHASADCGRCSGLGMYRLSYSRVMTACPDCLTRPAPAPDFSWHYQVDAQERISVSDVRSLKRFISTRPDRFQAPYARPPLFRERERRSMRPGLLRGALLGACLVILLHFGLMWGAR